MSIDTTIDGDPESIRTAARWLHGRLSSAVSDCGTQVFKARDASEWSWLGAAGSAFRQKMATCGTKADALAAESEHAGRSFDAYADELQTAQRGMARARDIAVSAGLQVRGEVILGPGPVPVVGGLPTDAEPAQVAVHDAAVAGQQAHDKMVRAYRQAEEEAGVARDIMATAEVVLRNVLEDIKSKPFLLAADFVNGAVVGGLASLHVSLLKGHAAWLASESAKHVEIYLGAQGGSPESQFHNEHAYRRFLEADEVGRRAASVGQRFGSKLPIVGIGLTAAGIGYDIEHGKPPGKAVISGVGGAAAAAGLGALAGSVAAGAAVGTAIPIPVAGTVVGAVVGLAVGLGASGALDAGYDALPDGVKQGIEGGFEAVGDGAEKVWDSLF